MAGEKQAEAYRKKVKIRVEGILRSLGLPYTLGGWHDMASGRKAFLITIPHTAPQEAVAYAKKSMNYAFRASEVMVGTSASNGGKQVHTIAIIPKPTHKGHFKAGK